jgi:hypothetical protein
MVRFPSEGSVYNAAEFQFFEFQSVLLDRLMSCSWEVSHHFLLRTSAAKNRRLIRQHFHAGHFWRPLAFCQADPSSTPPPPSCFLDWQVAAGTVTQSAYAKPAWVYASAGLPRVLASSWEVVVVVGAAAAAAVVTTADVGTSG